FFRTIRFAIFAVFALAVTCCPSSDAAQLSEGQTLGGRELNHFDFLG
nr:hypothetical protein [Chlamydiota bacterium]